MSQHARPVRTLAIARCYECPVRTLDAGGSVVCRHPLLPAPRHPHVVIPPPDWCPLRSEDLTVRVES